MTETKKQKQEVNVMDVVEVDAANYYKAVYGSNGSYTQEDRFDKSIGLKWLGGYKFAILNVEKWKESKTKHKL
jgi:hypothetical protein